MLPLVIIGLVIFLAIRFSRYYQTYSYGYLPIAIGIDHVDIDVDTDIVTELQIYL